jgi:hypothetical protein
MPALMAPSPITQMTLRSSPLRSRATAMPRPAEIQVEEYAAPNGSYWGRFGIRVKSGHKADDWMSRARLVISPTMPRLARPAIFP